VTSLLTIVGAAVVALVVLILAFKLVWRVAEPNEALIISGLGAHGDSSADMPGDTGRGFKIVVGRGTAVIPGFQTVRRFYLGLRTTTLTVKAPSNQSIPLTVKGVVVFKVADDKSSIANAARRFLEQTEDVLVGTIHELFAGHLRAIVGGLSVEDMLHNRESLTSAIRSSLADDLGKLGLIVDSLQIQEIDDEVGYINNLGKPQAAAIEAAARIAAAQRDQEATQAEQVADARKAEAVRQSQIEQAAYQADVDKAKAESAQAGPLMQAQARQEVVRAETAAAELDAQRQEKVLNTEVRKPADAEAYRQVTIANAERDAAIARAQAEAQQTTLTGNAEAEATKATGDAEAEVIRAKGLAEAAGIKARADALAENQDAVIAQIIAERYPEIVAAGAQAMANVDNMVVLNGGDGVEDLLAKAMTMGGAGLGIAQNLISSITAGSQPASTVPAARVPEASTNHS
jgi:flotillin